MELVCWYCGKTSLSNRRALYRHWGWCEEYINFKRTGILPPGFEEQKQKYIMRQTKHPMPEYMEKRPVDVPGYTGIRMIGGRNEINHRSSRRVRKTMR